MFILPSAWEAHVSDPRYKPNQLKDMKKIITATIATALLAALASTAHAETRFATAGRAGSIVVPKAEARTTMKNTRPETTVALVTQKPQRPTVTMQTAGRSGYQLVPTRAR